jgi:hypothetical protein
VAWVIRFIEANFILQHYPVSKIHSPLHILN